MTYKKTFLDAGFKVDGGITPLFKLTPVAVATAGAATYTVTQLFGRLVLRDPAGANRTDVSPTATLIVNAIPRAIVGSSFEFAIRNTADGDEVITVSAGVGVTLSGPMTVNRNQTRKFIARVTGISTPAVTIYSVTAGEDTYLLQAELDNISAASSAWVAVPYAGKIRRVSTILHAAITVADATITITTSVGAVTETITVAYSGSAAGDVDSVAPADHANVVVAKGTTIKFETDGGSTTAARLTGVFEIERT